MNIHVVVKDELFPRQFAVTGGEFNDMKDAVKATGATFDGEMKSWRLPGADAWSIIKQLRQHFTVEELPLVCCDSEFAAQYGNWNANPCSVPAGWLEVKVGQDFWKPLALEVELEITPEMAERTKTQFREWQFTEDRFNLRAINMHAGIAELERRAQEADRQMKKILKGKTRTKEAYYSAIKAAREEMERTEVNA